MATTAWKTPGSLASIVDGLRSWAPLTPEYLTSVDDSVVRATGINSTSITHVLRSFNFGFTDTDIPTNATITGIEIEIVRRRSFGSGVPFARHARLSIDAGLRTVEALNDQIGTNNSTESAWENTFTTAPYGGSSDLWGASLTPQLIKQAAFGFDYGLQGGQASMDASVDQIRMRVHYTVPTPASLVYQSRAVSASDLSTYTFTGLTLGAESSARKIVIGVAARAGGLGNASSLTVNGITASKVGEHLNQDSTTTTVVSIFAVDLPTGSVGDVVVNFSRAFVRAAIVVYRAEGIDLTPSVMLSSSLSNATTVNESVSLTASGPGVVLGLSYFRLSGSAIASASGEATVGTNPVGISYTGGVPTWTGVTSDTYATMEATVGPGALAVAYWPAASAPVGPTRRGARHSFWY